MEIIMVIFTENNLVQKTFCYTDAERAECAKAKFMALAKQLMPKASKGYLQDRLMDGFIEHPEQNLAICLCHGYTEVQDVGEVVS